MFVQCSEFNSDKRTELYKNDLLSLNGPKAHIKQINKEDIISLTLLRWDLRMSDALPATVREDLETALTQYMVLVHCTRVCWRFWHCFLVTLQVIWVTWKKKTVSEAERE